MPGPNSAPNGAKELVTEWIVREGQEPIKLREQLRSKGKLRTGKTELRRKKQR